MKRQDAVKTDLELEKRFERIYREHYTRMVSHINYLVSDIEQSEEIAQDVFVRLHRNLAAIASDDQIGGYLHVACRNAVKNEYRRRGRLKSGYGKTVYVDMEKSDFFFQQAETEEEAFLKREETTAILDGLAKLKKSDREIILMKEFGGQRYEDIAKNLKTTTTVVRGRLHKARQRLRTALGETLRGNE